MHACVYICRFNVSSFYESVCMYAGWFLVCRLFAFIVCMHAVDTCSPTGFVGANLLSIGRAPFWRQHRGLFLAANAILEPLLNAVSARAAVVAFVAVVCVAGVSVLDHAIPPKSTWRARLNPTPTRPAPKVCADAATVLARTRPMVGGAGGFAAQQLDELHELTAALTAAAQATAAILN